MKKPVMLVIMDGFAQREEKKGNAVMAAKKPNLDMLFNKYPSTTLKASGMSVGLPEGQMGNSEVGHLNIGAGRIVYQSLTRVNMSINDKTFFENKAFNNAIKHVKKHNSKLHIFGLVSDGGVHSHIKHIEALIDLAKSQELDQVYIHAFLDGRDVLPTSGVGFVKELDDYTKEVNMGKIATVSGRYYAMDRDNIWDRTQIAYDAITKGEGKLNPNPVEGLKQSYEEGVTDEFVVPFVCDKEGMVKSDDAVIFANFRPDRAIQISTAISNPEESGVDYSFGPQNVFFVSMMLYSHKVKGPIAFDLQDLKNTYGEVISNNNLKQLRIAETQKYAHVTFFFDGGEDKEIKGSTRVLIDSPKIQNFATQPEMSAYKVTDRVLEEIGKGIYDTIILNFANCDMVGHTADFNATVKAVEVVDECVGKIYDKVVEEIGGVMLITADHGNAEKLVDEFGDPFTAHTLSDVPFILTVENANLRTDGNLGDITPTMLELLNIEKPIEMKGNTLIIK